MEQFWTNSKVPYMIYLVVGDRNLHNSVVLVQGGLFANVGKTERTVQERLSDPDYKRKRAGGDWIPLIETPHIILQDDIDLEHEVHDYLKAHTEVGWDSESDNTEEFLFKTDEGDGKRATEIVWEAYNQVVSGKPKDKKWLIPYDRQKAAIDKAVKFAYNNNFRNKKNSPPLEFLLGAVQSFGKNITMLEIFKKLYPAGGTMVVLTGRPDVFDTLDRDGISKWMNYDDMSYSLFKKIKDNWTPTKKWNVLAVSKQLLDHSNNSHLVKFLYSLDVGILFVDEGDTQMLTKKANELVGGMNCDIIFRVTGTYYRLLDTGKYGPENSFLYTYIEQRLAGEGVELLFYLLKVLKDIAQEHDYFKGGNEFTLSKYFEFDDESDSLLFESLVYKFVDIMFDPLTPRNLSPYKIRKIQHSIWLLPMSSKACKEVGRIIEERTKGEYKVFTATANEVTDISEIKDYLRDNPDSKTITLTLGRFERGTTVEEWDAALVLSDTENYDKFMQFVFRPTRGNKKQAFIFDYCPYRTLAVVGYTLTKYAERHGITDPEELKKIWKDVFPMFEDVGNIKFKQLDWVSLLAQLKRNNFSGRDLYGSRKTYINIDELPEYLEKVVDALPNKKGQFGKTQISKDVKKGKNSYVKGKLSGKWEKKIKILEQQREEKIALFVSCLPLLCEVYDVNTLEEVLKKVPDVQFTECTGGDKSLLRGLCKKGESKSTIKTLGINVRLTSWN